MLVGNPNRVPEPSRAGTRRAKLAGFPRVFGLLATLVGVGCQNVTRPPPQPRSDSTGDVVAERPPTPAPAPVPEVMPSPPFPAAPEGPAPIGVSWQTVHHGIVAARLLVPSGWRIEKRRGDQNVPVVRLVGADEEVDISFNGGTGSAERGLLAKPPRYQGAVIKRVSNEGPAVAVDYVAGTPPRRVIESFARGLSCKARLFRGRTLAGESFAICASVRPAGPGAIQRRPDVAPLLTAVPEHAVVDRKGDATILFMGSLHAVVRPTRFDTKALLTFLRKAAPDERKVEVTIRPSAEGPVYLRRSVIVIGEKDTLDEVAITTVRSGRECNAHLTPFLRPPTPAEIDYAIALCDTLSK